MATTVVVILVVQLSGFRLETGGISLRPEHIVPFILILVLLRRGRSGANLPFVAVLYAPFLWYLTVTLLGAPDLKHSLQSTAALLVATTALPCLLVLGEEIGGARLLRLWLALGTAVTGLGLALYATNVAGMQLDVTSDDAVVTGLAYEANIYGSQAAALLIAALLSGDFAGRRSVVLAVVVNACALVLSQARGAWLGCAVVLILAMITRRIALRRLLVLLGLVTIAGLIVYSASEFSQRRIEVHPALLDDLGARAQSLLETSTGTGELRLRTWKLAMQDVRDFPLSGSGIGSYAWLHGDFTRPGQPGHLSNIYLEWLHGGGVIGSLLIGLSLLLYVRLLGGIRTAMENPALQSMLVLAMAYVATDGSWIAWPWALAGVALAYRLCS